MSDQQNEIPTTASKTTASDPVITARGLTRRYGKIEVVNAIDFDIGRGEVFGLLGPNGAGKTTTILMMLGLTEISSGEVSVLGFNPAREPLKVKRRVGYLPDAVGFYDQLTATENLAYTAKLMGLARVQRGRRIEAALARVGLAEVASRRVATFSRGMRQRLGLAEIIVKRAEIAILDEPTSGLDPQATQEFLALIGELKAEGVTVLLSSHMLDQVQRICDRVALFQAGRIVLMGAVPELAVKVLGAGFVVEVEAEGLGIARRLAMIPGVTQVETLAADRFRMTAERDVRPDAARAVVAVDGSLRRLSVDEPSLEAIYARYFQAQPTGDVRHAA
ncbi:ABC transporter ATP-binding protein [Bradyrhizobium sp. RDM4]|uniref:ABC transporter ATP-binding protein n=1 Tax=Bradyrhizobium sp. RDM4 TaxID=3378765 RepID=UPI0038FCBAC3